MASTGAGAGGVGGRARRALRGRTEPAGTISYDDGAVSVATSTNADDDASGPPLAALGTLRAQDDEQHGGHGDHGGGRARRALRRRTEPWSGTTSTSNDNVDTGSSTHSSGLGAS
jgi:hypothetical protein